MKLFNDLKWKKIILSLFCLYLVGCEDLIFPDPNNPTEETATIQSLVSGAEAGLRVDIGVYLRDLIVVGREGYYLEPADPRYTGELLFGPEADPGGFLLNRPWTANYKVIKNCITLQSHEDTDLGSIGFAKTVHAYCLMRVLNLTDENGARLNYDGDTSKPISTKAEVIAKIKDLLDNGYDDLLASGEVFNFTLSDGFLGFDTPETFAKFNRALKARISVKNGDWDDAISALDNSFMDLTGDLDEGVYHVFSSSSNDQENEMYEASDDVNLKLHVHPSYESDIEEGDPRFDSKIFVRDDSLAITFDGLSSDLAANIWSGSYDRIPIIRNEELMLLKAEALIGNGGDGLDEINAVRFANGFDDIEVGGLDQLLYEKRYSLLFEGHRLSDMRQYDKLDELPLDRDGDVIITFPIPETEIDE